MIAAHVIWHDLECGGYDADLRFWRELARARGGPVLDVGAGTGRIALELARRGHAVTALDLDPELLSQLRARAAGLRITTIVADARDFRSEDAFALCIVPMQTIQLLGGADQRRRFLACAARQLAPGGLIAIAIADELDVFEADESELAPLPDVCERDGIVYCSRATAVRALDGGFELERRRETVSAAGELTVEIDLISLDSVSAESLEREAAQVGLSAAGRAAIEATPDYVGSVVVMLRG